MFTIFLIDLTFDQYKEAMYIIYGKTVKYNGDQSDMAVYNCDIDIDCYEEFERCLNGLALEEIPFEY